tara:strand:- start:404 stop:550 length:147 start_codon:yes stop_codon:yes gene_type:complete
MNEEAADRKIKNLLINASVIINSWIPVSKRKVYLNFLNRNIIEEENND